MEWTVIKAGDEPPKYEVMTATTEYPYTIADVYLEEHAHLIAAAPKMAETGAELDSAIGQAIIKIAQATTLSNALIQIIQETILPAQEKWRKALASAEGREE